MFVKSSAAKWFSMKAKVRHAGPGPAEGGVHKVREGFYMGQNHGQVIKVGTQRVDLIEIEQWSLNFNTGFLTCW